MADWSDGSLWQSSTKMSSGEEQREKITMEPLYAVEKERGVGKQKQPMKNWKCGGQR